MQFEKVTEIPGKRVYHNHLKEDLVNFYRSSTKIAKIHFNGEEYADAKSAAQCIRAGVRRHRLEFPNGEKSLTIIKRGSEVFVVNNDIP